MNLEGSSSKKQLLEGIVLYRKYNDSSVSQHRVIVERLNFVSYRMSWWQKYDLLQLVQNRSKMADRKNLRITRGDNKLLWFKKRNTTLFRFTVNTYNFVSVVGRHRVGVFRLGIAGVTCCSIDMKGLAKLYVFVKLNKPHN